MFLLGVNVSYCYLSGLNFFDIHAQFPFMKIKCSINEAKKKKIASEGWISTGKLTLEQVGYIVHYIE